MELVQPAMEHLPSYKAALERGWSSDNARGIDAVREELDAIARDAASFVALQTDLQAKGPPFTLPDGTKVPKLPGYRRWMWDGEFCGVIGLRWQPGSHELPPTCLGHVGYAVVPWKRRLGYAKAALGLLLPEVAAASGLEYIEITTYPDNDPSRKVIEANGGVFHEHFVTGEHHGARPALRYRIYVR